MRNGIAKVALIAVWAPMSAAATPDMECSGGSQVEIGNCVSEMLKAVDGAVEAAYGFAMTSAKELDEITERPAAVPALEASQDAWNAYRDAQCDLVGALFGGGSGTGIGITSCRVTLGRARVEALLAMSN